MKLTAKLVFVVVLTLTVLLAVDAYLLVRREVDLLQKDSGQDAVFLSRALRTMIADALQSGDREQTLSLVRKLDQAAQLEVRWFWEEETDKLLRRPGPVDRLRDRSRTWRLDRSGKPIGPRQRFLDPAARGGKLTLKGRLLVVDDEPDMCELLEVDLGRRGHSVQSTCSPLEALDLLSKRNFDVVLADLHMPGMDGIDLCRRVAADRPDQRAAAPFEDAKLSVEPGGD